MNMHVIEQRILNKFKREPSREISTTEIVRDTHSGEYESTIIDMNSISGDKRRSILAKRKKGQLHRKVLYHLNNLIKEGVLRVSSIKGKGEKHFALTIDEGEMIFEKKHKQIVINKPAISTSLLDEYEKNGIVHKFDPESWVSKLNCILLESTAHQGINKLYDLVYNLFSEVNDSLGLNSFEHQIQINSPENMIDTLKRMDIDTKDYGRTVCLIINAGNITDAKKISDFISSFISIKPKNIIIVFRAGSRELKEHSELFKKIILGFAREEIKINIQNTRIHEAPIIIGKAGPYSIRDDEWKRYMEETKGRTIGLAIAGMSVAIDINRFFREGLTTNDFRELIMRISKSLLRLSITQNRNANEYFKRLNDLNKPNSKMFFRYQKNYVRFWNYDLRDKKQEHILDLFESAKSEVKKFCATERTIYNSCGMPTVFDIVFSSVFNKFNSNLSTRNYAKTTIRRFSDYDSPDVLFMIGMKERLTQIFEGGDRIRFFRKEDEKPEQLLKEVIFLMNTYDLPLITYDFRERKGEIKLTNFMTSQEE
jgi:hypothetical protein